MANDPWSQWAAFAEQAARTAGSALPTPALAEQFTSAARKYLEASANAPKAAADAAASAFGNFLRDQSMAGLQFPWSADAAGTAWAPPLLDLPALGLTREHQQRWQRMADAARRVNDAQRRLQRLWSDALRDAVTAFAAQIAAAGSLTGTGTGAPDAAGLRRLYDSWIDCAERAYAGIAHGEAFCGALAEFINAGSSWRAEFASSVEQWAKMIDMPTRSELNSLQLRLMAVEEQLRASRRQSAPPEAADKRQPAPPEAAGKRQTAPPEALGKRRAAAHPARGKRRAAPRASRSRATRTPKS